MAGSVHPRITPFLPQSTDNVATLKEDLFDSLPKSMVTFLYEDRDHR
jgi:hypothetical protein